MELLYCTITGADHHVDPAELAALAKDFPFVEWAIPYWPEGTGKVNRYPDPAWIEKFHSKCPHPHKALHMRDQAIIDFLDKRPEIREIMSGFKRIQLNVHSVNASERTKRIDPRDLARRAVEFPQWQFIIPHGEDTDLLSYFDGVQNHAVLFDGSAGTGKEPENWPLPLRGRLCGYAGGIGPQNIKQVLQALTALLPEDMKTWIDMETRVRDGNDLLDLKKVRLVLEAVSHHILPSLRGERIFSPTFCL